MSNEEVNNQDVNQQETASEVVQEVNHIEEHERPAMPDDDERRLLAIAALLSIVVSVIPSAVIFYTNKNLSKFGQEFLLRTLNFQILILIAVVVNIIPLVGQLLYLGVWVFNLVVCLQATSAVNNNKEFKYPFDLKLIA